AAVKFAVAVLTLSQSLILCTIYTFLFLLIRLLPRSILFPYTTLFRSLYFSLLPFEQVLFDWRLYFSVEFLFVVAAYDSLASLENIFCFQQSLLEYLLIKQKTR